MADNLEFKTTLKERQITIDDKIYIIKELDGEGLSKTRSGFANAEVTVHKDGTSSFKNVNLEGQEMEFLSMCLYDEQNKLVPKMVMKRWPSTMITALFNIAQELSGLTEASRKQQQAEAKNS